MPYFEIVVQYPSGTPSSGSRVVLGGTWGMSDDAYTDSRGTAVLEISDSRPMVYVDGASKGTVTPGKNVVIIG